VLIAIIWKTISKGRETALGHVICIKELNRANNSRHWPVFWASFAVVLVTWGLVPTQAGIFSIETVTRTTNMSFAVSTYSMPFDKQATSLSFRYMISTYGITALNETLPRYMTHNYTLAPFEPSDSTAGSLQGQGNYTAPTTMYTLDLSCEDVSHRANPRANITETIMYNSSTGCKAPNGLDGNLTVSRGVESMKADAIKRYTARYIGYHFGELADFYLSPYCPETANTTFYAAIARNKVIRLRAHYD
jgi:hypothetical protein